MKFKIPYDFSTIWIFKWKFLFLLEYVIWFVLQSSIF